jgi:hypothetical protein
MKTKQVTMDLKLTVDLDPVTGPFFKSEDFVTLVDKLLQDYVSNYNPKLSCESKSIKTIEIE